MKHYTATINIEIYADTDEEAIRSAKKIQNHIIRKHNPSTELESVQEHRFYGLNNRNLDLHKEQRFSLPQLWEYFKSLMLN